MSTTETPQTVVENATQVDALDLSRTQLLGLFGGSDAPRAMLRSADGAIHVAQVEDNTPVGEVVAITDNYVLLRENKTIHRLTMPL